jgi:hypothetical protein
MRPHVAQPEAKVAIVRGHSNLRGAEVGDARQHDREGKEK